MGNLTEKGLELVQYIREGRTDNPVFEKDIEDLCKKLNATNESVRAMLLSALG